MDYRDILKSMFTPRIGSIWKAPNCIWTNGFARNKKPSHLHPSIIDKVKQDKVSVQITPGTTMDYNHGDCVFKLKLTDGSPETYFLLKLSMPYLVDDLKDLDRGWNRIDDLSDNELSDFLQQIKVCRS